jgi:hypothetical protein
MSGAEDLVDGGRGREREGQRYSVPYGHGDPGGDDEDSTGTALDVDRHVSNSCDRDMMTFSFSDSSSGIQPSPPNTQNTFAAQEPVIVSTPKRKRAPSYVDRPLMPSSPYTSASLKRDILALQKKCDDSLLVQPQPCLILKPLLY